MAELNDKRALFTLSYGLYIISSTKDDRYNGQIANSIFQVTSEPATIAVSINRQNLTHEFINASRVFSISVLSQQTPMPFIGQFGFKCGRDINKFEGIKYKIGQTNTPLILDNTISVFEIKVINQLECGTHTIFIGEVVNCEKLNDLAPMTYDYYHVIKGGKSPKTAPTYIKEEKVLGKYECDTCGYIYDPRAGDPDNGIKADTAFTDLPEDWVCPTCGAEKNNFKQV